MNQVGGLPCYHVSGRFSCVWEQSSSGKEGREREVEPTRRGNKSKRDEPTGGTTVVAKK